MVAYCTTLLMFATAANASESSHSLCGDTEIISSAFWAKDRTFLPLLDAAPAANKALAAWRNHGLIHWICKYDFFFYVLKTTVFDYC